MTFGFLWVLRNIYLFLALISNYIGLFINPKCDIKTILFFYRVSLNFLDNLNYRLIYRLFIIEYYSEIK